MPQTGLYKHNAFSLLAATKVSDYTKHITIELRTLNGGQKKSTTFFQGQTRDNELFYYIAMKMMMSAIVNYVRKRGK